MSRNLLLLAGLAMAVVVGCWVIYMRTHAPLPVVPPLDTSPGVSALQVNGDLAPDEAASLDPLARPRHERKRAGAPAREEAAVPAAPEVAASDLVIDQLAELEDQAAAGDPVAACRTASLLAACGSLRPPADLQLRLEMLDDLRERARNGSGDARRHAEQRIEDLEREQAWMQRCAGVDEALLALRPWLDVRAAKLGDTHAAQRFLSGVDMGFGNLIGDPALARFYRENAWPLFQELLQSGQESAVWLWSEALNRRSHTPLWAVLPEDWHDPQVAHALTARIMQRRGREWQPRPGSPAAGATISPEADARAEALWARYFRDRPPREPAPSRGEMLRRASQGMTQWDAHCADLAGGVG